MPTTVEVMVEAFKAAGTPFLVGHPGGESVELLEAARQGGVRFLFAKQESAGAMIAATWGDLTGAPGVCLSTRATRSSRTCRAGPRRPRPRRRGG